MATQHGTGVLKSQGRGREETIDFSEDTRRQSGGMNSNWWVVSMTTLSYCSSKDQVLIVPLAFQIAVIRL